jgi:hypothetical protein
MRSNTGCGDQKYGGAAGYLAGWSAGQPAISAQTKRTLQVSALLFDAGDVLYYRPDRGNKLKAFLKELD